MSAKLASVLKMAGKADLEQSTQPKGETPPVLIDADELARRWNVPSSWIRSRVRERVALADRIPHIPLGRYIRFKPGPELDAWLEARKTQ
jgi:hypothetical protein